MEMQTVLLQRACHIFCRNTSYFVWILSLQKYAALLERKITLVLKGMLHFCFEYCMHLLEGMGILIYIVIDVIIHIHVYLYRICKNSVLLMGTAAFS